MSEHLHLLPIERYRGVLYIVWAVYEYSGDYYAYEHDAVIADNPAKAQRLADASWDSYLTDLADY